MLATVKTLLVKQYEAVLSMLRAAVEQCPDNLWHERVASYPFSQVVHHTLFFTDLYLGFDHESFLRQPFHRHNEALFAGLSLDVEPFEDPEPRRHDKASLLAYLEFCRRKATEVMAAETEETLTGPEPGRRPSYSRAELHVYNIRHVHHHAAQLGLRLRLETGEGVEWVGSGWHEAVPAAGGRG